MIVVLAQGGDEGAVRLVARLRHRLGDQPGHRPGDRLGPVVRLVTDAELAMGARVRHRPPGGPPRPAGPADPVGPPAPADPVGADRVVLPDGTALGAETVRVVYNRLPGLAPPQFDRARPADRDYAAMEASAWLVSWLAGLGDRVVNRPSPRGAAGPDLGPLEALARAQRAGLPVHGVALTTHLARPGRAGWARWVRHRAPAAGYPLRLTAPPPVDGAPAGHRAGVLVEPGQGRACRVLVAGRQVLDGPPGLPAEGCRRLAADLGCRVLELSVVTRPDGAPAVVSVDPLPPLVSAAQVAAVADLLYELAEVPA